MISQQTLTCEKGGTFSFEIDMQGDTDLTGASGSWVLAESWFDGAKILLTKPLSISYDAGIWKASVQLNPVDTLTLPIGTFFHDSKVALGDGTIGHVSSGTFVLDTRTEPEPLECERGDNFTFEIDVGDADLTSATATWTLAESWFDGARVYITKTNGSGLFIDAIAKKIVVQLIPQDTLGVPSGTMFHACDVTLNDGTVGRVASGTFILEPSVDIAVVPTMSAHATQTLGALGQTVALTSPRSIAAAQTLGPLGQTATATAGGSVSPDFQTNFTAISSLPAEVSLSRATTGTRFNSSGVLVTEAIDAPRFDYAWNGSAWVAKGLLIEEQRTNLVFPSGSVGGSGWNPAAITATANATTAPDGTNTAYLIKEDSTTADHAFFFLITVTSGATYTWSVFAKAKERSWLALSAYDGTNHWSYFNLGSGAVGSSDAGNTASIQSVGNGWYRCILTRSVSSASATITVGTSTGDGVHSYAGDGTSGIYAWGGDIEAGSFVTSYIPTTSAAVTRSADIVELTGTALVPFQGAAYSVVMKITDTQLSFFGAYLEVRGTASSDRATLLRQYAVDTTQVSSNRSADLNDSLQATLGSGSTTGPLQIAFGTDASGSSLAANGGTVASDALTNTRTIDATRIAGLYTGDHYSNMHCAGIALYSSRLSDATLQVKSVVGAAF